MVNFAYAAPYVPPAPPSPAWFGMPMTWTGWDGTVWDLTGGTSGVSLGAGVRGLNMPPTRRHVTTSPAVAGSRRRGWSTDEREVFWPVSVYREGSGADARAWAELDAAFWRTMHPDRPGIWSVESPLGTRRLEVVYDNDGGHTTDLIPTLTGWERYPIYLAAEQPYWFGDPISKSWKQPDARKFFGQAGDPYLYYVSSGFTFSTAKITNPGDVEAWPVWEAEGPFTSVTVGVGGRKVTAPFTVNTGSTLVIDTNPNRRTALLDGVNVYQSLSSWNFAPIPPGEDRDLSLSMVGVGRVKATITPRYFRAWG